VEALQLGEIVEVRIAVIVDVAVLSDVVEIKVVGTSTEV
jgi:hypothetical protein